MAPPLAIFGITNDALNLAVSLLLLFLVVLWLALVYWTHADAKRRVADPMLVACATAAALFPFVGTIVYMVVRPPEFLEDVHEREIEIAAAEARLAAAQEQACPYCEHPVERSFLRCPHCERRLKQPCGTCGKPLDPRWQLCPYCEAEVPQASPKERKRERRGERPAAKQKSRAPADGEPERRAKDEPERRAKDEPRRERQSAPAEAPTQVERPSGPPARQ